MHEVNRGDTTFVKQIKLTIIKGREKNIHTHTMDRNCTSHPVTYVVLINIRGAV